MSDLPVVLGVPVSNPAAGTDPSAPPAPPPPSFESQLAQCVHCQRLSWREEMVYNEETEQYQCREGCTLLRHSPRRTRRCCTIS